MKMEEYTPGALLWWDTGKRGSYGHVNLSTIPAQFSEMSHSGKRARIRIVGVDGRVGGWVYVKPTAIWVREGPFGELKG